MIPRTNGPILKAIKGTDQSCKRFPSHWRAPEAVSRDEFLLERDIEVRLGAHKVRIRAHEAIGSLVQLPVLGEEILPKGMRKQVPGKRLDENPIIVPNQVKAWRLGKDEGSAPDSLMVKRGNC